MKIYLEDKNNKICLPKDLADALKEGYKDLDNLYLLHHRFAYFHPKSDKRPDPNDSVLESFLKLFYDRATVEEKSAIFKRSYELLKSLAPRANDIAKAAYGSDKVIEISYTPADKLMIGVGGDSPYGNLQLMTLHPLYGVPYIPASAIKGALRHYWEKISVQSNENDILLLFGSANETGNMASAGNSKGEQGDLVFFDIFPCTFELGFDVQTPHYQAYYQSKGTTPPTDDIQPVPIIFPYIKPQNDAGEMFRIYIAFRNTATYNNFHCKVKVSVEEMLQTYGFGAKTAYGYGIGK